MKLLATLFLAAAVMLGSCTSVMAAAAAPTSKQAQVNFWQQYRKDPKINYMLSVQYVGQSDAVITLYKHTGKSWQRLQRCDGFVGKNGMGKQKEGDMKTPLGIFSVTGAFGIKPNPGTKLDYVHINKNHYYCGDQHYYNTLIDIKEKPHNCDNGEHMLDYIPQYNYGLFLDYNKKCIFGKGSGIFVHVRGKNHYTA